jgi:hypothetical protein
MRCIIRKIRHGDPGFDTPAADDRPWLVYHSDTEIGLAFSTFERALYWALTGRSLHIKCDIRKYGGACFWLAPDSVRNTPHRKAAKAAQEWPGLGSGGRRIFRSHRTRA